LYFWKRFIRIAPLYYLTLLAIILIFGQKISGYKELILRLFTFTAYYPYLVWPFYYLWTISVLVHYYLLAPAIYLFSKLLIGKFRINPLIPLFAVLIIGLVYRSYSYFLQFPPNPLQGMALAADVRQNLYIFTFGFLLNPLVNLIKNRVSLFLNLYRPGISLILLLLIFLAGPVNAALQHFNPADFGMYGLTLSYAPVLLLSALFIVISESGLGISGSGSRLKQFFLLPLYILQIIGTLSYELYLFHYPVIIKLGNSCESGCTLSQFFLKIIFTVSVCATMALTIGLISGAAKNFTRRYTVKLFS
jgi:peptidoglycan/LPS O-acetylase OafA/YrhL